MLRADSSVAISSDSSLSTAAGEVSAADAALPLGAAQGGALMHL